VLHRRLAADLSTAMIYALLRLRVEVFVVEQNCPYQELDGHDLDIQATIERNLREPTSGF